MGAPRCTYQGPKCTASVACSIAVIANCLSEIKGKQPLCSAAMRTGLSAQTCSAVATSSGRQSCWPTFRCTSQPSTYDGVSRVGRLCGEPPNVWLAPPAPWLRSCTQARRLHVQSAIAEPPAALVEQESFPRGAQWQVRLLLLTIVNTMLVL